MQLELSLQVPAPAEQAEVDRFVRWLYDKGDRWMTARQIEKETGFSDRKIRQFARTSPVVVSGPGCPGYKHMDHCDREEFFTSNNRLMSQAKDMSNRAARQRREWYRGHPEDRHGG